MTDYIDPKRVDSLRLTEQPTYGRNVSGYGPKIPTQYVIGYEGRARRVYVMQYANSGSAYIVVNGQDVFLDSDTEHDLAELARTAERDQVLDPYVLKGSDR